jgi:hypothetical protein
MREITNGLATLAAVSNQADFNNIFTVINQVYTAWTRNAGHRVQLTITPPTVTKTAVAVGALEDEEDMDITNGATKHLNDDPSLSTNYSKIITQLSQLHHETKWSDVAQLAIAEGNSSMFLSDSTSSVGLKVSTSSTGSVTMKLPPDDTVFGFAGGHLVTEEHLEEYGDLNCFTAPSGGPVESTGNMNLFEDLPGE